VTSPPAPAPATAGVTWSRAFPATPCQVGQARRFLAGLLGACPAADDALLCLSELAANAVQHSRSARPGGQFTVRVSRRPGWLRAEVTDAGGPWVSRPASDRNGRGLLIVRSIADSLHVSDPGAESPARTVAFEMRLG
jgi:anti-sigma regulatory factor (Ser/Thr protein kinase)